MTEEQIKFILESVNFYEKSKIYTKNDIKTGKPAKPIPCYVITTNYGNPNFPNVYYGEYDGNNFLSSHVSNPYIITHEESSILGYIEYK